MEPEVRVVLVSVGDEKAAGEMARTLVEEGLAACVTVVGGVTSVYRWEGETRGDDEALMVVKTSIERVRALRERVVELHSYELPEVLVVPVVDGYRPYLEWVCDEVAG